MLEVRLDKPCIFGNCNYVTWAFLSDLNTFGNVYTKLDGNKVHLIQLQIVDSNLVKALNLQDILNQYGKPTFLLFSTEPDLPGDIFLELTFVYPEKQFLIRYSKYATLSNDQVISCGKDSYIELIILDNSEQLMSLTTIANAVETKDLHVDVWHKTVEEAMGITIDKFYQIYSKTNAPCISTPTKVWLQ